MDYKEFYNSIGVNYEVPLRRFGGERLLLKYLNRMPTDPTFGKLRDCMKRKDAEGAFRAAHTLKGVALNLELTPLAIPSSELAEMLRDKRTISAEAIKIYRQIESVYNSILEKLK